MASIKDLKKDINFLTEEVIGTCFLHYYIQEGNQEKQKAIDEIVDGMIEVRNELIMKVNGADKVDGSAKKYYKELSEKLMEEVDKAFDALAALSA